MAGGSIAWNALAGNDRLAVDYSAGTFFAGTAHLPLNLNFGGQAGDFLLLTSEDDDDRNSDTPIETAFTAQSYVLGTNPGQSTLTLTDSNGTQTIAIAGLSAHVDDELDIPAGGYGQPDHHGRSGKHHARIEPQHDRAGHCVRVPSQRQRRLRGVRPAVQAELDGRRPGGQRHLPAQLHEPRDHARHPAGQRGRRPVRLRRRCRADRLARRRQ